jgi:pyruvate/2-oxoglutarate dehydrogenase complex dihydrolipoamide dehydrogenase (E3) component
MDGLLKAMIEKATQRILGCTILAAEAGEMIGTVQAAMIAKMPATMLRAAVSPIQPWSRASIHFSRLSEGSRLPVCPIRYQN